MALLTPAYKLTFRQAGGGDPLASLSSAAASVLGSGGKVIDTTTKPQASTVTGLTVELGMDGAADAVTLAMGQVGHFRPAVAQAVDVELGYADDGGLSKVVTATIVEADPDLLRRRVVAHGAARALLRTRLDRTFENRTAGDIVRALADAAGVPVATADAGILFPAYVVDGRRSAYEHVGHLAALCGFDRYVDTDGKLVFAFFAGGRTVHVFEYGRHILELELRQRTPDAAAVVAWGESPGAGRGDDSWAWLTKDFGPYKGTAGSGTPSQLLERTALRTGRAAAQAAQAALTTITRRARQGSLLVTGAPQVRLGDALRIANTPEQDQQGTFQVRAVTHRVDKRGGFTSVIRFRSIEG
jgi:phage protein D